MAGCQVAATRPTGEISDVEDDELWRRMNQASTVCGVVSDCGASTGQPSAGGSAESSTPTLAQSSAPSLGSHDDAKGEFTALLVALTWRATLPGWVRVRIVSDSKVSIELVE